MDDDGQLRRRTVFRTSPATAKNTPLSSTVNQSGHTPISKRCSCHQSSLGQAQSDQHALHPGARVCLLPNTRTNVTQQSDAECNRMQPWMRRAASGCVKC
jgi:hypothetical protein